MSFKFEISNASGQAVFVRGDYEVKDLAHNTSIKGKYRMTAG